MLATLNASFFESCSLTCTDPTRNTDNYKFPLDLYRAKIFCNSQFSAKYKFVLFCDLLIIKSIQPCERYIQGKLCDFMKILIFF